MNTNHETWESWEEDFLREVYPLPEWSPKDIAEKLERSINSAFRKAYRLNLTRTKEKLDYAAIAKLKAQSVNANQIAIQLGYTSSAVRYALKVIAKEAA